MWPETLEDENQKAPIDLKKNPIVSSDSTPPVSSNSATGPKALNGQKVEDKKIVTKENKNDQSSNNSNLKGNRTQTRVSEPIIKPMGKPGRLQPEKQAPAMPPVNLVNQPTFPGPQPPPNVFCPGPIFVPNPPVQEMPLVFGPQPMVYLPLPPENMPLQFQNMPMQMPPQNMPLPSPGGMMMGGGDPTVFGMNNEIVQPQVINDRPNQRDLREELDKKRQHDNLRQGSSEWNERKVTKQEGDGWSRNVFVEGGLNQQEDRREKVQDNFQGQERNNPNDSFQRNQRFSPERGRGRGRGRFMRGRGRASRFSSPDRPPNAGQRFSPDRQGRRFSPDRQGRRREWSPERRERSPSYERRFPRQTSRDRRSFSRSPSPYRDGARHHRSPSPRLRRSISPRARNRDLWDNISERYSESIFMYKYVKQDSRVETDPFALLRSTRSPDFSVDFDFITLQVSIDEWQVSVELVSEEADMHPLVGEGMGHTENEARLVAARHAVDTIEKACRTVEPNFSYFADGMEPEFVVRKMPMKTPLYEIIQNLDPSQPVDRVTIEFMLNAFIHSEMEDIFFLANDFSYMERALVVELADQMNLWWRVFGRRHPDALPENIVSTQHVCVFKQKSALEIVRELMMCGGQTEKFILVDRRLNRMPRPTAYRQPRGQGRGRGRGYNR